MDDPVFLPPEGLDEPVEQEACPSPPDDPRRAPTRADIPELLRALELDGVGGLTAREAVDVIDALTEAAALTLAKQVLRDARLGYPTDDALRMRSRALAPSTARMRSTASGSSSEQRAFLAWARDNASRFPGRWVLVHNGQLVASGKQLPGVRQAALAAGLPRGAGITWFVPEESP